MRRLDVLRGWRERWNQPGLKPVARQLAAEMMAGAVRTASPFGLVEGRVDLRGLQVDLLSATRDPMYERHTVQGGHWHGLDLTGAGLSGLSWMNLRVSDCVLVDAQLDDLRCWGIEVSDCAAGRASLRYAQIGWPAAGFGRSAWRRVDLRGADLRQLTGNVLLEDVDLGRARFGGTDLSWSDLVRVRFAGTVNGLRFGDLHADQRPPRWTFTDVDFTAAKPRSLALVAVDLGAPDVDIRLPDDADHWVIRDWLPFLDRVEARTPPELHTSATIWVNDERHRLGPHQSWGFVSRAEALDYAGEGFVELLADCR